MELDYRTYEAMVKVTYGDEGSGGYHDAIRSLPGVTTVTIASEDSDTNTATYKVKIISQKEPNEAFQALKDNATGKFSNIISVEVGEQTIEEK